jgi:hypothetical protein
MPVKKTTSKTAKTKEPTAKRVATGIGEHDLVLDCSLTLKTKYGDPVKVECTIPFNNALVPAFIPDTQQAVQQMVETVIRDRFLLQSRHFFNNKREESLPKVDAQPLLKDRGNEQPKMSDTSQLANSSFDFEEETQ